MTTTEKTPDTFKVTTAENSVDIPPTNGFHRDVQDSAHRNTETQHQESDTGEPNPLPESTFNLKGSLLTLMVLELHEFDFDRFNHQMTQATKRAPNFFQQTPIVISLEKLKDINESIDFLDLSQLCREYGLHPVAIKGGTEEHQMTAIIAGLPKIPANKVRSNSSRKINDDKAGNLDNNSSETRQKNLKLGANVTTDVAGETTASVISIGNASKTVTKPVRSGQQIYAPGGDLIILAPVSAGAEVLADGNIHVYGSLRGRALAGVKGNTEARIFCHSLEAELVSIAGHYKVSEDLRSHTLWKKPMQARLQSKHLIIEKI